MKHDITLSPEVFANMLNKIREWALFSNLDEDFIFSKNCRDLYDVCTNNFVQKNEYITLTLNSNDLVKLTVLMINSVYQQKLED